MAEIGNPVAHWYPAPPTEGSITGRGWGEEHALARSRGSRNPTPSRSRLARSQGSARVPDRMTAVAERAPRSRDNVAVDEVAGDASAAPWRLCSFAPQRSNLHATSGRGGAACAPLLYRPYRRRRLGACATAATVVALRCGLGRRTRPPLEDLGELCAAVGIPWEGSGASIRSWRANRLVLCICNGATPSVIIKVGRSGDEGLEREAEMLPRVSSIRMPFQVPSLRWYGSWRDQRVLAVDVIRSSRHRGRNLDLDLDDIVDICSALAAAPLGFIVHGDLAPWNIIPSPGGRALIDWEMGRMECDPLHDLAHYVTSCGELMHRHTAGDAVAILVEPGSPGWRHLERIGMEPREAPRHLERYLRRSRADRAGPSAYRTSMAEALRACRAPRRGQAG